jgi:hypothetical protein
LDSLSFILVLGYLGSWDLAGDRKGVRGLGLGRVVQSMHLLLRLALTQWKQILWPQVAVTRLWKWRWQVWQLRLYFIG